VTAAKREESSKTGSDQNQHDDGDENGKQPARTSLGGLPGRDGRWRGDRGREKPRDLGGRYPVRELWVPDQVLRAELPRLGPQVEILPG